MEDDRTCSRCGGTGEGDWGIFCSVCGGSGEIKKEKEWYDYEGDEGDYINFNTEKRGGYERL